MRRYSIIQKFNALARTQTIITSALPCTISSLMASYYYRRSSLSYRLQFFLTVISFHLAVNGHNQYTDYPRYKKNRVTSYNSTLEKFSTSRKQARNVIILSTLVSAVIDIIPSFKIDWITLLAGFFNYLIGCCYPSGPYPILKTPFGEPASGTTTGCNITLLGIYVNVYNIYPFDNLLWAKVIIVIYPAIFVIVNVMLANNICDVEEDIKIGRRTPPLYTGCKNALIVLCIYYVLIYTLLVLSVVLHYLPTPALGGLLTISLVYHSARTFVKDPHGGTTLKGILMNVLLVLVSEIIFSLIELVW